MVREQICWLRAKNKISRDIFVDVSFPSVPCNSDFNYCSANYRHLPQYITEVVLWDVKLHLINNSSWMRTDRREHLSEVQRRDIKHQLGGHESLMAASHVVRLTNSRCRWRCTTWTDRGGGAFKAVLWRSSNAINLIYCAATALRYSDTYGK